MRLLVIHADDLGLHPDVNAAIVAASRAGTVRSASLLATGAAFDDAVSAARGARLDVGVHLDLTQGRPVTPAAQLPWLTLPGGGFRRGSARLLAAAACGAARWDEIEREWDAQILKVRASGLSPSHVDSHQHVHALPVLFRIAAGLAARHGIPFIRVPAPAPWEWREAFRRAPSARVLALGGFFPVVESALRSLAADFGLRAAGRSHGLLDPVLDREGLIRFARRLGPGVNELCVHLGGHQPSVRRLYAPAFQDPAASRTLTAPGAVEALEQAGARLTSFGAPEAICR